jgi:hypothetical protein
LTIDPVLESATLLGGSGDERLALANPTTFIVGSTTSPDIPGATVGPHRGRDIFVYSPQTQSTIVIGGSGDEVVTCPSAVFALTNTLLIGGYTNSRDLPARLNLQTALAPQTTYGGGDSDGFIAVITDSGPLLVSYLGGSGEDRVLAVDIGAGPFQSMAVAGVTTSPDFPLAQPWQQTLAGGSDGFVAMLNLSSRANGSTSPFTLSTYLGGSGDDRALTVALASPTDIYVGGETSSTDWSLTGVSWTGSRQGTSDGFLLHAHRADPLGPFLPNQAAFWGGSAEDRVTAVKPLPNGKLAVAGVTASADFAVAGTVLPGLQGATDGFLAIAVPDLATAPFASRSRQARLVTPAARPK